MEMISFLPRQQSNFCKGTGVTKLPLADCIIQMYLYGLRVSHYCCVEFEYFGVYIKREVVYGIFNYF